MNIDPELREMAELLKGRRTTYGEVDVGAARQGLLAAVGPPVPDERVDVIERTVEAGPGRPTSASHVLRAQPQRALCGGALLARSGLMVGAPETEWGTAVAAASSL